MRERKDCEMQVVGAGALNQAIKAIAIARTYLAEDDIDLSCVPEFAEIKIDGRVRTAIRLAVRHQHPASQLEIASPGYDIDLTGKDPASADPVHDRPAL